MQPSAQALGKDRQKDKAPKGRKNTTVDLTVGMLRLLRGLRFAAAVAPLCMTRPVKV